MTIYKRDTAGKIRVWDYEVETVVGMYRTVAGIRGGKLVTSAWTVCAPKNVGRINETSAVEQAAIEGAAEEEKKLKREYRRTIAELDDVMKGPMLADTFKGNVSFPVFSQPKLDGIRALISAKGAFTRELQPHFNVDHILAELSPLFAADPDLILDGELYNHDLKDNFNRICQLVRKQTVTPEQRADIERLVQFHVYDIPSDKLGFGHRAFGMRNMSQLYAAAKHIRFVETTGVGNQESLDAENGAYTSQGYEGQMVRLDAPYEFDTRSKTLLKRKEFDTAEFPISEIFEGEGNWAGYAKRVEFILPDDKRLENGDRPGAGMRGDQTFARELLAKVRAGNSPKQVTLRFFGYTPGGIPRFPVAIDFHNGRTD